jgi:sulfur relay (sulfurtransferase) complex TusBCD TusD component (DsrE family)
MTEDEKLFRREEQLKITERTYRLQDFHTAYRLADWLLIKFCGKKYNIQTRFYEIAVMTALVEDRPAHRLVEQRRDHPAVQRA